MKLFVERNRLLFRAKCLKIGFDSEKELVDEDAFGSGNIVLPTKIIMHLNYPQCKSFTLGFQCTLFHLSNMEKINN